MRYLTVLLLLVSGLAGCLSDGDEASTGGPDAPGVSDSPLADYLHNVSKILDGVDVASALVEQYQVPAEDGTLLDTWIVRPDLDEPVPVVLTVTPYYGGGNPRDAAGDLNRAAGDSLERLADELVSRGYAFGISSVRGTGNSEGCFSQGGVEEAFDTAAVIEAMAAEAWSNGNVGLIGASYPGTTPQDVWVEAPPSLKAIVPTSGISDLYKYNFVNGVPIDVQGLGFNTYYWAMVGAAPAGLKGGSQITDAPSVPGAVIGEVCEEQVEVQEGGVSSTLDGNKDAYWQERDFLAELEAAPDAERAAVLYIHGLQDWNVKPHMMEDWLPAVQAEGAPFKAFLGQWAHAWPDHKAEADTCAEADACRNDWWTQSMVAWFDQFLKDIDTGILDAPAVQVQDDDGVWRHEAEWPPQDVRWDSWYLDADVLTMEAPGSGEASFEDLPGNLRQAAGNNVETLPVPDSGIEHLAFVSEPLAEDLHVSGLPVFTADVTASGDKASLVLTLAERMPDGSDRAFNFAAQSLNHVESLEAGASSIAGVTQTVSVRFFPQDDVVHAGNRLVLYAAGNTVNPDQPGPALIPIASGSTITLDLATALLELPVDTTLVQETPQPFDA